MVMRISDRMNPRTYTLEKEEEEIVHVAWDFSETWTSTDRRRWCLLPAMRLSCGDAIRKVLNRAELHRQSQAAHWEGASD